MSNGNFKQSLGISAVLLLLVGVFSAQAGTIVSGDVVIDVVGVNTVNGTTMSSQIIAPIQPDGSFSVINADVSSPLPMWTGTITNANGNIDPFTNLAFGVTNIAPVPVEFSIAIAIPIAPIFSATVHGGSTGGSVTDSSADALGGVTPITSVPGTPFYAGKIDGATVLSIYPGAFSFPVPPFSLAGETLPIPAANVGLPATLPSGPALVSIGIAHKFTLSAGDSMSATSFFRVEPVPEPSSFVLAAVGVVGLVYAIRRRRRK